MQKCFIYILVFILSIFFSNCRKGSEDPFLSFSSRKARLAGDWSIVSYNENQSILYTYPSGNRTTEFFNRNFAPINYQETTSNNDTVLSIYNGKISRAEYHFSKSGNWNSVLEYYLYIPQAVGGYYISKNRNEEEGTWKFNESSGNLKNKESMDLVATVSNNYYYTYSSYLGTVVDSISDSTFSTIEKRTTWKLIGLGNTRINAEINFESTLTSSAASNFGTIITTTSTASIEMNQ